MSFADATAVQARGDGSFAARVDGGWSAPLGPNGGYLAGLVLRALSAAVDDAGKHARSLTCHFLAAPAEGPVVIEVTTERAGRSVSMLSARLIQDGHVCVLALAAFGVVMEAAADYDDLPMPDVPSPQERRPFPAADDAPSMFQRVEMRPTFGPRVFSGGDRALTGGWLALEEGGPWDAEAVAFATDAWFPAPWTRLTALAPAPTLDLTIHFRRRLPHADDGGPVLVRVHSDASAEGYFEEDAVIWAPDGTLLAQSRQLALLRAPR